MNIVQISHNNSNLLSEFINKTQPKEFRYYTSRNIKNIKNHILTILGICNNVPIAYGHIDYENDINWVGLCVLEPFQHNGYGKQIFKYLLDFIQHNHIINIQLSVDIDNYKAQNLYLKNNFYISNTLENCYIMKYDNYIKLPVSVGEALDKLSIIYIKMNKITDNRRLDVKKEFDILNSLLEKFVKQNTFYYNILLKINKNIWDMQDIFRESTDINYKNKLCIKIIKENDNRFRVKKKINNKNKSYIKEQKGYKYKKAFVLTHLGLGDNITSIGAIRYLSTCYDKVYVVCKNKYKKNVQLFYHDDDSIEIYPVNSDKDISPKHGFNIDKFKKITTDMDVYLAGSHCVETRHSYKDLPLNFYKDMNIPDSYFKDYFYIYTTKQSKELFSCLKDIEYVFIHNTASNGEIFNLIDIENKFKFNRYNTYVINPNKNEYNKHDSFFELAEVFLNKPLPFYITTIINASRIIMTDSSFYCMSALLPIKTDKCYLKPRNNSSYSWDTKFLHI